MRDLKDSTIAKMTRQLSISSTYIEELKLKVQSLEEANVSLLNEAERFAREKHEGIKIVQEKYELTIKEQKYQDKTTLEYAQACVIRADKAELELKHCQRFLRIIKATCNGIVLPGEDQGDRWERR